MGRDGAGGSGSGSGSGSGGGARGFLNFSGRSFFTMPMNSHTYSALTQVAVARGLNNVDELLAVLGKRGDEISQIEALDMLMEEVGLDACKDHVLSEHYRQSPRACRSLLNDYWDSERAFDQGMARMSRRDLVKFCGFSDDSESLNRPPKPSST